MGGRGQSSTTHSSKTAGASASISTAKSSSEIADILRSKYSFQVDGSFESLETERARSIASGVDEVFSEFGEAPNLHMLKAGVLRARVLGVTSASMVNDNISSVITMATNSSDYGDSSMDGVKGTIAHELGHVLISNLINQQFSTRSEKVKAYNSHTLATKIMSKAIGNVKKTEYGKGKNAQQLRAGISAYAGYYKGGKGNNEALAEAVDDYIINRGNCNPLSQEAVKILKQELGR